MNKEHQCEIEQELRDEHNREQLEGNRRNICPACGRDKSNFITTTYGDENSVGWTIECKCGYLIDED